MKPHFFKVKTSLKAFLLTSLLASGTSLFADDTEVFYSANVSKPNLLFLLDISGSMSTRVPNSGTSANNTVSHTVQRRVANRDDDAEQASSGGQMLLRDSFLDLGYEYYTFGAPQRAAMRFFDLGIPQGAEITSAYIQFEVRDTDQYTNSSVQLSIVAEATDSAARFGYSGNAKINERIATNVSVDWDPPVWTTVGSSGEDQRTSDLTPLVQSIVDRSNWRDDNGMVFIIEGRAGNTGNRVAKTYDQDDDAAPMLVVNYDTVDAGVDKTRLEVMQESLRRVLEKAPDNVNVGLMNYGQESLHNSNPEHRRMHAVSGVAFPITDINEKARTIIPTTADVHGLPNFPNETSTVREYIADIADSWTHSSWTPIVDALYEAALYYRGEKVHYGQSLPTRGGAHPVTYDDKTNSYPGGVVNTLVFDDPGRERNKAPTYKSPINSSCQANYIVLMTDGAPTYTNSSHNEGPLSRRNSINTGGPQGALADAIGNCADPIGVGDAGTCGAELTAYLATNDNIASPSDSNPNGQYGDQIIETFSIGFGTSGGTVDYLKSLATYDDGDASTTDDGYYAANTPEELAAAFQGILESVAAPTGTLASPGYSVNVKNGLENEKDIYIPVFDRKNSSRWSGNLKKFRIVDSGGSRLIRGKNNQNATDEDGNFTENALDYWSTSTTPDGGVVEAGGVANLLTDPASRVIVSNLSGDSGVALTAPANSISAANISNIDAEMLGLPATASLDERTEIVNFMRGFIGGDETAGARKHMGDMLHSEPVVITYDRGGNNGAGKQQYIFAATNEGYLHAFDAVTGEEKFAFIPKELLKIAEPQFRNAGTQVNHPYGVDGIINFQFQGGKDGKINGSDKIMLYFGLRRGGSSYYALDVTNINAPKLVWTKSVDDYPTMGQSWSKPYLRQVGESGSTCIDGRLECRDVVIISGGYDVDEDRDLPGGLKEVGNASEIVVADVGNDVLILDALTGQKVWSMPPSMRSQITSSIPGGLRAIDSNQNGLVDRMYFGDTGGNVWRLDLSEAIGDSSAAPTVLNKLGDFGSSGRSSERRKFYNEPEVSSLRVNSRPIFTVSIGSGFRAHPMDETIDDRFYIMVDDSPYSRLDTTGTNSFSAITENDLSNIVVSGSSASATGSMWDVNKRGWVIKFSETGEKVLSGAYSFNGQIVFSTLVPEAASVGSGIDQCSAPITQNNTYFFDILSGNLIEKVINPTPGIPNVVQPFFNAPEIPSNANLSTMSITMDGKTVDPNTGNVVDACEHMVDLRKGTDLKEISGYNSCTLESVYWSDPVVK